MSYRLLRAPHRRSSSSEYCLYSCVGLPSCGALATPPEGPVDGGHLGEAALGERVGRADDPLSLSKPRKPLLRKEGGIFALSERGRLDAVLEHAGEPLRWAPILFDERREILLGLGRELDERKDASRPEEDFDALERDGAALGRELVEHGPNINVGVPNLTV